MNIEAVERWVADKTGQDSVAADQSLFRSGLLDSFDLLELVVVIEGELGRRLPVMDVNPRSFDTLAKISAYLDRAGP